MAWTGVIDVELMVRDWLASTVHVLAEDLREEGGLEAEVGLGAGVGVDVT